MGKTKQTYVFVEIMVMRPNLGHIVKFRA